MPRIAERKPQISKRLFAGLAVARAKGRKLGRQAGNWPKSDRLAPTVLALIAEGRSYRWIARDIGLSKNTITAIIERSRTEFT